MKYSSTDVAFLMHLESWFGHLVPLSSITEDIGYFLGKNFHLILPLFEAHGFLGYTHLWKSCQFVSPLRICITTVFVYFKQCK